MTELRVDASRITCVLFGEIVLNLTNKQYLLILNIYFSSLLRVSLGNLFLKPFGG